MKTLALTMFALLGTCLANAQVRDYGFAVEPGFPDFYISGLPDEGDVKLFYADVPDSMIPHSDATRYLFMNTGGPVYDTVVSGPGFPIGFDFIFDGEVFDRFGVSANRYLKLGKSSDGIFSMFNDTAAGGIFASGRDSLRSNVIGAMQSSSVFLETYPLKISYGIFGYPGERICRILVYYRKYIVGFPHDYAAQFGLLEKDNSINLFCNSRTPPANTAERVYCGIRGNNLSQPVDSNFKSWTVRDGLNTWPTAILSDSPDDWCDYRNGLNPQVIAYVLTPTFASKVPDCPTAYFRETNPTNPAHIHVVPSYPDYGGYYLADGAIQVPTNPLLWWSPGDPRDTLLFDVYLGLDSLGLWLVGEDVATNSLPLGFLAANTRYYCKVVAKNGSGNSPSCVGSFVTGDKVEYCLSQQRYHSNSIYDSLAINTFFYKHPSPGILDTQKHFPPVAPYTTTLKRDSSYQLSYKKTPITPNCHTVRVWIDFNQNGIFDVPSEQFAGISMVTVPTGAKLGPTRMRAAGITSCVGFNFGPCPSNNGYQDFTITIAPSTACSGFVLSHTANGPLCHGDSSGIIALNPSGGTPPYAINWEHMGNALSANGDTLANLPTGTYQAFVADAAGCPLQTPIIPLVQPYPFVVDTVTINNELTAFASGGTQPYLFEWLDSSGTVADSLEPGTYTLSGTDANGCFASLYPILIPELPDTNPCPLPPCDTIPNPCPNPPCDTTLPCNVPPCDTVGLGTVQNEGIFAKLYPNPASATLYLTISRAGTFELYNLFGKRIVLLNLEQVNTAYVLDISTLASGVYLYRFKTGDAVQLGKVVIQN